MSENSHNPIATRVLMIDDDPQVRSVTRELLAKQGIELVAVGEPDEGLSLLEAAHGKDEFDALLLDLQLPNVSGWDVLDSLRQRGDATPVLLITGVHYGVDDRVRGLGLGADDFLAKPFDGRELIARLDAVLRRERSLPVLRLGDLRIDLGRRIVQRGEERIDLSPREFHLLTVLAEGRGKVVPRRELLTKVWGMAFDPGTNVLEVQVARLRRKMDRTGPPLIETSIGEGYRLNPASVGCGD